jgi:SPP1 gp7 family putative phage head morphogenesis protein
MTATLFDAFTRHQVYLEGYKDGLEGRLDPVLRGMFDDLSAALARTQVDNLGQLTKKRLRELIRTVQRLQLRRNDAFRAEMLRELRAFAQGDARMTVSVVEEVEGKTLDEAYEAKDGLPLLGVLALRNNRQGRARLWALIESAPDPATGKTTRQLVNQYLSYVTRNVREIITRGYANGWTVRETLAAIFGTRARRFKDGFTATARHQGASMLHTAVQHISQTVQAAVASVFYKAYEWVSVLDRATSDICRFRDGKVYIYGKGPLPPAHYRCRSTVVPVKEGVRYQDVPGTFYGWLQLQPAAIQNDVVGSRVAGGLRSGRVTAETLGRYRSRKRLTLAQFLAKFTNIIR